LQVWGKTCSGFDLGDAAADWITNYIKVRTQNSLQVNLTEVIFTQKIFQLQIAVIECNYFNQREHWY
jgi:hypothetical protein